MKTSTYTYDPRPGCKFQVTAVKYAPENPPKDGLTLILAHANGMHKETWSALISYLFDLAANGNKHVPILEAWSIEAPNHGESAVLNEADIATHYPTGDWNGWEYPQAMLAFINSRPDGVNFYERNLVGVGHSHGGNTIVLLHDLQPRLPISFFILMDPTIGPESKSKNQMNSIITYLAWTKRDTWQDRKAARKDLESQPGSRNWHPKVLEEFLAKGIRAHPASKYADPWKFRGVTLACTRAYEAAITRANSHHADAYAHLHEIYRAGPPVHLICSKADEFGGTALKEALMLPEPISGGKPASVQRIEKGGHMFVQTMPEPTADAIYNALVDVVESKITIPLRAHL